METVTEIYEFLYEYNTFHNVTQKKHVNYTFIKHSYIEDCRHGNHGKLSEGCRNLNFLQEDCPFEMLWH